MLQYEPPQPTRELNLWSCFKGALQLRLRRGFNLETLAA
jgi:hypothetical protein